MKKLFFIIALVCMIAPMADEIMLSRGTTGLSIVADQLQQREKASLVLECNIHSIFTDEVETEVGTFTRLSVPGWTNENAVGAPDIPVLTKLIELPRGGEVSVHVLNEVEATAVPVKNLVYPTQPSFRKDKTEVPFSFDKDSYFRNERKEVVKVEEVGILRGSRLVLVQVLPISYDAENNMLAIQSNIQFELIVENADWEATHAAKTKYASSYFKNASTSVMTPASLECSARGDVHYLIIAADIFKNSAKLQEFIAWKESIGFAVKCAFTDETGATNESIRDYVKATYEGNCPPTFALFVGDHEEIPGWSKSFYTDLYYFTVDGSDYLPDVMYGRFSARNEEQLAPQVDKTIAYEKGIFADADFLKRYALVAGYDRYWAIKRGYPQIRYAIREYFKEPHYVANEMGGNVFLTSTSGENKDKIVALVNSGVGFFNYTAHGDVTYFCDPAFRPTDIDNLTNKNMYTVVLANCCLTGSFQADTCFGEKWLRAKDKGAIAFIGGSSYTYWNEDFWFGIGTCTITSSVDAGNPPAKEETGDGTYDAVMQKDYDNCNFALIIGGNLAVEASNTSRKEYYWKVYHLFGDPSVKPVWANK
ncbi:MAG TPA: C25 family cysteine peptidase [Planctomycetota bacterium]|nr:C25 family cysteine peptidase [Planctomycetota bacterium]HRU51309.1 C25 family cysteine peptidase [Planctomycetota bacterium]